MTTQERSRSAIEVYAVPGRVVLTALFPLDQHGAGWGMTDELLVVEEEAADGVYGNALATMLERSLTASRTVDDSSERRLLKAAGVRSYRALVRTARYVSVSREGDGPVLLLPGASGRRGGGWITVGPDEGVVVSGSSASALGAALRTAIERSTTTPVDD